MSVEADSIGDELVRGIVAGCNAGIDVEEYCSMRDVGANHDEVLEWRRGGGGAEVYVRGRNFGLSHAQLMVALRGRIGVGDIVAGYRDGLSFEEMLKAVGAEIWLHRYVELRAVATRREVLAANRRFDSRLIEYGELRYSGASHRQSMRVLRSGAYPYRYIIKRGEGASHRQALIA